MNAVAAAIRGGQKLVEPCAHPPGERIGGRGLSEHVRASNAQRGEIGRAIGVEPVAEDEDGQAFVEAPDDADALGAGDIRQLVAEDDEVVVMGGRVEAVEKGAPAGDDVEIEILVQKRTAEAHGRRPAFGQEKVDQESKRVKSGKRGPPQRVENRGGRGEMRSPRSGRTGRERREIR